MSATRSAFGGSRRARYVSVVRTVA